MMTQSGWNTWNVRSVLSHVHLPEGFAISLGIKSYHSGLCLRESLIGRKGNDTSSGTSGAGDCETVFPGPHAYDGSVTALDLEWDGVKIRVETAVVDDVWFAVVTPLNRQPKTACLTGIPILPPGWPDLKIRSWLTATPVQLPNWRQNGA